MKYELHSHTKYSGYCSNLEPKLLLKAAKKEGLDGIAITDHNSIKGALIVKKLNKDKDFKVIVGEEISTNSGHLLAYNVNKTIKSGDILGAIEAIKKQGGIAVHAHPLRIISFHKFLRHFSRIKKKLDALEIFNGRSLVLDNLLAKRVALKNNMAGIGGSDAHFAFEIGAVVSEFDNSLEKSIKSNNINISGNIFLGYVGCLRSSLSAIKSKRAC